MNKSVSKNKNVSRVQFIDITVGTAWMIDGELWRFRHGTELAIGPENDLEAAQPMVTARVALSLINAGKAQPSDTLSLDAEASPGDGAEWVEEGDADLESEKET